MLENRLEEALRKCWSKETSSDSKGWSENNTAWGQSIATALVVNDYFGGEIVWSNALMRDGRNISYYRNKSTYEHDIAEIQFPESTIIPTGISTPPEGFNSTREYLLSIEDNLINYGVLKIRVEKYLKTPRGTTSF